MLQTESELLTIGDFIQKAKAEHEIEMQAILVKWLVKAFVFLLVSTVIIIFLQGFKAFGFELEKGFLHWLGGAAVGEVAGILVIIIKYLFPKK